MNYSIDIKANEQWDPLRTIQELEAIEESLSRFISHTATRLAREVSNGRGGILDFMNDPQDGPPILTHPVANMLEVLESIRKACISQYGEEMYREAKGMNQLMLGEDNEGTT